MNRDMIYRQDAIDALERKKDKNAKGDIGGFYNKIIQNDIDTLMQMPSAQPDNRVAKIADLVEGSIDHFDLDDAMDLLYKIKEVLQHE